MAVDWRLYYNWNATRRGEIWNAPSALDSCETTRIKRWRIVTKRYSLAPHLIDFALLDCFDAVNGGTVDLDLIAQKLAVCACRLAESHFYGDRPRAPDIADFRDAFLEELYKLEQERN